MVLITLQELPPTQNRFKCSVHSHMQCSSNITAVVSLWQGEQTFPNPLACNRINYFNSLDYKILPRWATSHYIIRIGSVSRLHVYNPVSITSQGTYAVVIVYCAPHNFWQRKWDYYILTLNRHWKHSWPSQSTHLKSHQESKNDKRWFSTIFHQHKECTVTEYIYICNCTF